MSERRDLNAAARAVLAAAERAKAEQDAAAQTQHQAGGIPERQGILADDTLGRILKAMEPPFRRYMRKFGTVGLLALPIRIWTLYRDSSGFFDMFPRAAAHDPFWMLKFLWGCAVMAATWWALAEAWRSNAQHARRKRALKAQKASADARLNSQS